VSCLARYSQADIIPLFSTSTSTTTSSPLAPVAHGLGLAPSKRRGHGVGHRLGPSTRPAVLLPALHAAAPLRAPCCRRRCVGALCGAQRVPYRAGLGTKKEDAQFLPAPQCIDANLGWDGCGDVLSRGRSSGNPGDANRPTCSDNSAKVNWCPARRPSITDAARPLDARGYNREDYYCTPLKDTRFDVYPWGNRVKNPWGPRYHIRFKCAGEGVRVIEQQSWATHITYLYIERIERAKVDATVPLPQPRPAPYLMRGAQPTEEEKQEAWRSIHSRTQQ
jgi:hypothetical protein